MEQIFTELEERCKEADLILVGIGEEFQFNWNILQQDERYQEIEKEIDAREEYMWIVPFLQKLWIEKKADMRLNKAYEALSKLISDKNYFIISTAIDDSIYQHGFREDRIVSPVGGFRKMQCDYNCKSELLDVDYEMLGKVKSYYNKELTLNDLQEPTCDQCGQKKRFNQLGVTKYAEEGYLSQWEKYTKWLQGTVNKKLCVIELGVGLEMPNIIRWPFEKIILYNQKSHIYRIHSSLYQLGENVGDRGTSIKEKPVDFLTKGFVK
ncbi:MAG: hypothetical protein J6B68_06590 [Lachnospiraceae bacterium]|nr:hypothetical protein [Lachnospiraceae bacterium]